MMHYFHLLVFMNYFGHGEGFCTNRTIFLQKLFFFYEISLNYDCQHIELKNNYRIFVRIAKSPYLLEGSVREKAIYIVWHSLVKWHGIVVLFISRKCDRVRQEHLNSESEKVPYLAIVRNFYTNQRLLKLSSRIS